MIVGAETKDEYEACWHRRELTYRLGGIRPGSASSRICHAAPSSFARLSQVPLDFVPVMTRVPEQRVGAGTKNHDEGFQHTSGVTTVRALSKPLRCLSLELSAVRSGGW